MAGVTGGRPGRLSLLGRCSAALLALVPGSPMAAEPDAGDTSQGFPDNPVSDYVDRTSDGLTEIDPPGTSAPSLTSVQVNTPSAEPVKAPKPAEWMLVPLPGYNPTLGFTLTGMGAYIFPADAKSPPSTVGGFGMFSSNGSWADHDGEGEPHQRARRRRLQQAGSDLLLRGRRGVLESHRATLMVPAARRGGERNPCARADV